MPRKPRLWTQEQKDAFALFRTGKKHSAETIQKMKDTAKRIGKAFPKVPRVGIGIGRTFSEEHKRRIGDVRRGVPLPLETRLKISKSLTGRPMAEELKLKIKQANIGRIRSQSFIEKQSGPNNPRWKGGISYEPYCPKFNRNFKERVRAHFGYRCVECGNPQPNEKLSVHHIGGNKQACCDNQIPLFAPLCRSCHGKVTPDKESKYRSIIMSEYGGKCYLTKDEMIKLRRGGHH